MRNSTWLVRDFRGEVQWPATKARGRLVRSDALAIIHVIHESVLGCRSVAFDEHAIKRMYERKVSEDEVLDVLRNPDETSLRTTPGRLHFRKNYGASGSVDVIFEQDPTQIVVFSVWRK
jgi:Domain of unknown function (DUF4258)